MRVALLSLVIAVAGCKVSNPHYCPDQPNNLCTPDGMMQTKCESPDECTNQDEPVCKLPAGVCVQCTADEAGACMGTTPICNDGTNQCEACDAHTDCPSGVCMADGSCANENDVAYVEAGKTNTSCVRTAACGTLDAALAVNRPVVKLAAGTFSDADTLTIESRSVTIVGEDDASEIRNSAGSTVFLIRGSSPTATHVMFYRVKIAGSASANTLDLQLNNGGMPEVLIERVTIGPGGGRVGILANGANLTMTRSTVLDHNEGAINILSGTRFKILHNIFRQNGGSISPNPTIEISGGGNNDVFEFNTIAGNTVMDGLPAGLDCAGSMLVRNNIIWLNNDGAGAPVTHVTGTCLYKTNIIGPGQVVADNMDVDPQFVDQNTGNYMLKSTSPAKNSAAPDTPTTALYAIDFEGQPRPNPSGQRADLGADEVP